MTGTPVTKALEGDPYSFQPAAQDADGDALTFTVTNPPRWATFDRATGRLHGTPTVTDVGVHRGIVISVSDGLATVALPAFDISIDSVAHGAVTLTWSPPTQNTDDSPLVDLAGFNIYWGTEPDDYPNRITVDNVGITTQVIENLAPGTYYFAASAFNANNIESDLSEPSVIVVR